MNKLETITELLVNELTDFEKNVTQLSSQIDKAESLRVKFDISPIKELIDELKGFQKHEINNWEQFLSRLEHKLQKAKIYPKWAVVTFVTAMVISTISLCFAYRVQSNFEKGKQQAYQQGINDYEKYLNSFFEDNPKTFNLYKKWKEK